MEFYELLEMIVKYVPDEFDGVKHIFSIALPLFFAVCSVATCFFGHMVHKIWNAFFFFWIGFIIPALAIGVLLKPQGALIWTEIVFSAACGVCCARYAKHLHKGQLFVTTFFMVFASFPSYLSFLGKSGSVLGGFIIALSAAIFSIKYKYIMTIATTSFSGAFILLNIVESAFHLSHILATVFAVLTALSGLAVQCYVEREELNETHARLKERSLQIKKTGKKIKEKMNRHDL